MCQAIVLAAGYSSRAKTNKLALEIMNIPLLEMIVMTLRQVCSEVVVVSGHYHEDVMKMFDQVVGVRVVKNNHYELGMFSSVKTGTDYISEDCFITPGDYPLIKRETCELLLNAKGDMIVPTYNKRRGHPLLIKKQLIDALKKEPVTSNLKEFRDRYRVTYVPVEDEGILQDVDTMEDYRTLKKLREGAMESEN